MNLARVPGHPRWTNMCQFTIQGNAAGNSLRLECASDGSNESGLRQFGSWSHDMKNWHPIRRTTVDGTNMLVFPKFTEDKVYFGGEVPMSYEQMADLATRWEKHEHATVKRIGTSMQGRPILRVTIADPNGPYPMKTRWSHHAVNQHCYEYNSQWRIVGMIDWLLSDAGAECRRRSVSHFVVMMNVDGPHNGYARVNQQGIDMNRAYSVSGWADNPARESQAVQKDLEALDKQTPITTTWSMHTWAGDRVETMLRPGPEMGTTVGPWSELRDIIKVNDTAGKFKTLRVLKSKPSPTHWTSGTHLQLGASAFCCEGAGLILSKEENLQTGAVLMKSLDQF
ncbi:MAG: M14 family zinc carboxypeptidase, partial [Planctomycetota bacterium]|nr:M14 family zinc carboxypeptidase [Planctomycetota bacterium]